MGSTPSLPTCDAQSWSSTVPVAFARAALTRHPTWTYHEIHHAGHHPHRDRPEAWAKIVTAWLERPTP